MSIVQQIILLFHQKTKHVTLNDSITIMHRYLSYIYLEGKQKIPSRKLTNQQPSFYENMLCWLKRKRVAGFAFYHLNYMIIRNKFQNIYLTTLQIIVIL